MAKATSVKSSSDLDRKEASFELWAISFNLDTLQTLADDLPFLQFYQPF